MVGSIRVCVPVCFCVFINVISLNMSIFTCYMFVYMYVHALTPPECGLQ